MLLQHSLCATCERHADDVLSGRIAQVFLRNAVVLHEVGVTGEPFRHIVHGVSAFAEVCRSVSTEGIPVLPLHIVGLLCQFRCGQCLAVDVYDVVLYLQGLSGLSDATLDIVFAAVDRSADDFAVFFGVLCHIGTSGLVEDAVGLALLGQRKRVGRKFALQDLASEVVAQTVEVGPLGIGGYGVSGGIGEDHNVSDLNALKTFHAAVFPLRPFDVALSSAEPCRHVVLCKGHGGDARPVVDLRYEEIVAGQQAFLQR